MTDTQMLFVQFLTLAFLSLIALVMLYFTYVAAREYLVLVRDLTKRHPVLIAMLGALAALPVVLIFILVLRGA